jgi:hypothetical protein
MTSNQSSTLFHCAKNASRFLLPPIFVEQNESVAQKKTLVQSPVTTLTTLVKKCSKKKTSLPLSVDVKLIITGMMSLDQASVNQTRFYVLAGHTDFVRLGFTSNSKSVSTRPHSISLYRQIPQYNPRAQ